MNHTLCRLLKYSTLVSLYVLLELIGLPQCVANVETVNQPASSLTQSTLTQSTHRALSQLALGLSSTDPKLADFSNALTAAIAELTTVIESGHPSEPTLAKLYFNRGLAQSQLGNHTAALLDFRRSDAAYPTSAADRWIQIVRDRIVASTLADAGSMSGNTHAGSADMRTHGAHHAIMVITRAIRSIPTTTRWWTSILAFAGVWLGIAFGLHFRSMHSTGLRLMTACALLVGIAAMTTVLVPSVRSPFSRDVIVTSGESTPLAGPDRVTYGPKPLEGQVTLQRGSELVVVETRELPGSPGFPAWLRVQLKRSTSFQVNSSNADAWIPASDVEWVAPLPRPPSQG